MIRRPAVTLIEALMAILVMAIGLLALLTLFPLGAVNMAQALKDERTAQACLIAVAQFKAFDLPNDPFVNRVEFENAWNAANPLLMPVIDTGPSYPIFVDPIGWNSMQPSPALPALPMGGGNLGIFRTTVNNIPAGGPGSTARWFTLQDDMTFGDNGAPSSAVIEREGRYTWAYMVRRQAVFPSPTITPPALDLTVVVYSGRSTGIDAVSGAPLGEALYANTDFVSGNTVVINWLGSGLPKPALRRGQWVLDARMQHFLKGVPIVPRQPPQGYFYRVVNVTDLGDKIELEVQRPLGGSMRGPTGPVGGVPGNPNYNGPLIVMDNVSEVFEKGTTYLNGN